MIYTLLFLILPLLLSGLSFIFLLHSAVLRGLSIPLDGGIKIHGKRLFGDNKTIKGPLVMSLATAWWGTLIFIFLNDHLHLNLTMAENTINFFIIGLSYSVGELPNSFIKRQLSVESGKNHPHPAISKLFVLIDAYDSLIFAGFAYLWLFKIEITQILIAIFVGGLIHLLTDELMIMLNLKERRAN